MSIARFLRRSRWDEERTRELESYLDHEIDDNVARGMSRDEARVAARRRLGNVTRVREEIYDMNTVRLVDNVSQDLRFGLRLLRRNPGFAAVAVLSLALGIGANTAIFQLLDAVRLRPLPVRDPRQLAEVIVNTHDTGQTGHFSGRHIELTYPLYEQIRAVQRGFSALAAWGTTTFNLASSGEQRPVEGIWVSGDFFDVLGVPALVGRTLSEGDDRPGCGSPPAVLGYGFWQSAYGGDRSIVGRTVRLNGHPFEIAGVMPASFFGVEVGHPFDVAVPICSEPMIEGADSALARRDAWFIAAVGRLNPDWTLDRASAQLAAASPGIMRATLPQAYVPDDTRNYLAFTLTARSMGSGVSGLRQQYETPLWILLGIAGLVLLIACANLANLMLARASAREREIGVRLAIGASRARVVRQLLSESVLLAAAGAGIGMALAGTLSTVLVTLLSTHDEPVSLALGVDWRVLAFTIALAMGTCVLFGIAPALHATRPAKAIVGLTAGTRGSGDTRERFGLRRSLVVAQVAISLVLLVAALLFVRTLRNLTRLNPGFREDGLLVVNLDLRDAAPSPDQHAAMFEAIERQVRAVPGVDEAALTRIVPISGMGWNDNVRTDGAAGRKPKELVDFDEVGVSFFRTLGIPLVAGRPFDAHDIPTSPKVAIVNQMFAHDVLGAGNPIGRVFRLETSPGEPEVRYQIVGVVGDTKYSDLREVFKPIAYLPFAQNALPRTWGALMVRSRLPLTALTASVGRAIADVDPAINVEFQSLRTKVLDSVLPERLMAVLAGFFGALAALLAMIGLYGVMAYAVARRRNEIGIRMALGADRGMVIRMVMREAATLVGFGLVVGLGLSLAAARPVRALLFGLGPRDPSTLALAAVALATVGVVASYVPAMRAARLDPTEALRDE